MVRIAETNKGPPLSINMIVWIRLCGIPLVLLQMLLLLPTLRYQALLIPLFVLPNTSILYGIILDLALSKLLKLIFLTFKLNLLARNAFQSLLLLFNLESKLLTKFTISSVPLY